MKRRLSTRGLKGSFLIALLDLALAPPLHAITHGQLDGTAHPYVGAFLTADTGNACSGSLLSPWVFLTAAHCVTEGELVFLTADEDALSPDALVVTGTAHPDPESDRCEGPGKGNGGKQQPHCMGHDVAVITLDAPIFVSRYAQLPEEGLADTLRQGQPLTVVGYGAQSVDPSTRDFVADGHRYGASVNLDTAGQGFVGLLKLSANPGGGKGGICYIDSGGPDLLDDVILSINTDTNNALCRGITYGYRIDQASALEFIESFLP